MIFANHLDANPPNPKAECVVLLRSSLESFEIVSCFDEAQLWWR